MIRQKKTMRTFGLNNLKHLNKLHIQKKNLSFFINDSQIFNNIEFHNENDPLNNHTILLIKSIISCYYALKIKEYVKKKTDSLQTWYNKMVIFKGQ